MANMIMATMNTAYMAVGLARICRNGFVDVEDVTGDRVWVWTGDRKPDQSLQQAAARVVANTVGLQEHVEDLHIPTALKVYGINTILGYE